MSTAEPPGLWSWLHERNYALVTREALVLTNVEVSNLHDRVRELRDIKRRAEEMRNHEGNFGGRVADYILYGLTEARS